LSRAIGMKIVKHRAPLGALLQKKAKTLKILSQLLKKGLTNLKKSL